MLKFTKKVVSVFIVLIICFSFMACFTTSTGSRNTIEKNGQILQLNTIQKDFRTIDVIFIETTAEYSSVNGLLIRGSPITYEMLMKEAQKLGADDIYNLRIDEHITIDNNRNYYDPSLQRYTSIKKIKYKANALAIKYL